MSFVHELRAPQNGRRFVLLHGTGGDERDLIPLAQSLDPAAGWISPRGQVDEKGALRFFRRLAEGVFDLEDLHARTHGLADFLATIPREPGERRVALGFSNGANVAASLLLARPEALDDAILIRAMTPFSPDELPDLAGKRVLLLSGQFDPILPVADAQRLAQMLSLAGAEVQHEILQASHGLTRDDVRLATEWLSPTP